MFPARGTSSSKSPRLPLFRSMDKTALAAQLASCAKHTGDELVYAGVSFFGNVGVAEASISAFAADGKAPAFYRISAPLAQDAFAARTPKQGDYLTAPGFRYRLTEDPVLNGSLLVCNCLRTPT